jgi:hypothetical protein
MQRQSNAADPKVTQRVGELIAILGAPEADGKNLEQTSEAIGELVGIGVLAAPHLIKAIIAGNRTAAAYSALALDRIGKPAVDAVREEWKSSTDTERWKLMHFRGAHDYDASVQYALSSLSSNDKQIRSQAIQYLGDHKEAQARQRLLHMLNREIPALRWHVVKALARLGGDEVIDALIELLRPDSWAAKGEGLDAPDGYPPPWWPDGRPHVVEALRQLNTPKACGPLVELLKEKGEGKAYLASYIIPALMNSRCSNAVPELEQIHSADPTTLTRSVGSSARIQQMAAEAIASLGSRQDR